MKQKKREESRPKGRRLFIIFIKMDFQAFVLYIHKVNETVFSLKGISDETPVQ